VPTFWTRDDDDADKQAWSGRFNEPVADLVKRYTASVDFDKRLALFDIRGSLAMPMLAACEIIGTQDLKDIQRGMAQIENEVLCGEFDWQIDLEDVHLNIEKRLTAWLETRVSVFTRDARAMIRWRPMYGCICATLLTS